LQRRWSPAQSRGRPRGRDSSEPAVSLAPAAAWCSTIWIANCAGPTRCCADHNIADAVGSDRGRACVRGASTNQRRGGRSGRVGGHAGSGRLRPRLRVRGALSAAQHRADPLPCAVIGRPTRFTPERMQQVRNLVERGTELPLTQDRGVAGSTGPALTPGTWFVSQGDPWLHAFCAADRGRGFTSSDGLRRSLLRCADAASTTQDKGATD
jgi:hypothetical protein